MKGCKFVHDEDVISAWHMLAGKTKINNSL